jgi:hypothetical protein
MNLLIKTEFWQYLGLVRIGVTLVENKSNISSLRKSLLLYRTYTTT